MNGDCIRKGSSLARFERSSSSKLTSKAKALSVTAPISLLPATGDSKTISSFFDSKLSVLNLDNTRGGGGRLFVAFWNPTSNAMLFFGEIWDISDSLSVFDDSSFDFGDSPPRSVFTFSFSSSSRALTAGLVKGFFTCSLPGVTPSVFIPEAALSAAILSRILPPVRVSGSRLDSLCNIFLSFSNISVEELHSPSKLVVVPVFLNNDPDSTTGVSSSGPKRALALSLKPAGSSLVPFSCKSHGAPSVLRMCLGRITTVATKHDRP